VRSSFAVEWQPARAVLRVLAIVGPCRRGGFGRSTRDRAVVVVLYLEYPAAAASVADPALSARPDRFSPGSPFESLLAVWGCGGSSRR